jgi:hypothetical protein
MSRLIVALTVGMFVTVASLPCWSAGPVSDTSSAIEQAVNDSYSPLLLPQEAAIRGIGLSGKAKVRQAGDNRYKMSCGCVMITSSAPVQVDTCRVQVFAKANTSFVLHADEKVSRVLNLSDRAKDSLKVMVGDNHIVLNPGEEMSVGGKELSDAAQLTPSANIKYRRPQLVNASGTKVLIFEFSLADALKQCVIFRQLRQSPLEADQKLLKEIVKTAAAVNTMFGKSREKYSKDGKERPEREKAIAKKGRSV